MKNEITPETEIGVKRNPVDKKGPRPKMASRSQYAVANLDSITGI